MDNNRDIHICYIHEYIFGIRTKNYHRKPNIYFKLLQETLHNHNGDKRSNDESIEGLETASHNKEQKTVVVMEQNSKKSLLTNWPLMSSIIVYCVFSLHDMAYSEVFLILYFIYLFFFQVGIFVYIYPLVGIVSNHIHQFGRKFRDEPND